MASSLTFDIQLDHDTTSFRPGDEIAGTVAVHGPHSSWQADFADLVLFWRTDGRGIRDEGVVAVENLIHAPGQKVSHLLERLFRFPVPRMPWTYHGRLIQIHWYLGVYARGRGPARIEGSLEIPLIVHPYPERFTRKR